MSLPRGRQGPGKFAKRPGSGPRDRRPPRMRHESNSGTRMNANAHNSPTPLSADSAPLEEPPQWFFMYMETFKKELISEVLTALDSPLEEEEKRRRYKKSYFMLKSRLHKLEKQMEEQSYHNGSAQAPQLNGATRNAQNFPNIRKNTYVIEFAQPNDQADSSANSSPSPSAQKDLKKFEKTPREGKKSHKSARSEERKETNLENSENCDKSSKVDEKPQEIDGKSSNVDGKNSTIVGNLTGAAPKPPEDESRLQELSKKIRSILNKLAPSNFHSLLDQVKNFHISTPCEEEMVISHLFEKAIDEPMYSTTYALMCKQFVLLQPSILRLRRLILSKCETEFKTHTSLDNLKAKLLQEMTETEDEALKKDLQVELTEIERNPKEFMGDILFIGELYNQDLLSNNFLHKVIQHFLQSSNETDLEYLCKLLKISGEKFESRGEDPALYYEQLSSIAEKEDLTPRVKFMIKDLIDMRLQGEGRREDPEDDFLEIFSFSKALDDACDAGNDDAIREKFYREIQSQFNLFESANFTRELLNSAIERSTIRKHYFDVFRRSDGNKIVDWVGGDKVFLGIILRELKLFFTDVHELSRDIPEAYDCLKEFLEVIVADWQHEFGSSRLLDVVEGLRGSGTAGKFIGEVFQGLKEKIGEERIKRWISGDGFAFGEFLISEGEKVEEILEKYGLQFFDRK